MAIINEYKVFWSNWPGAPGYSTFYGAVESELPARLATFFDSIKAYLPNNLTIQSPGSGDQVDTFTGEIVGAWTKTLPSPVVGTATGNYAGSAGAVVHWRTSVVRRGRRLRGRTFLVPLAATAMDSSGSLGTTPLATIQNAATALVTAMGGDMYVWGKPDKFGAGTTGPVTSATVPDLAVVLRSRRV